MSERDQTPDRNFSSAASQKANKAPTDQNLVSEGEFIDQTQKGRNKNDGDPSKQSNKPLDHQDIGN